MIATGSRTGSKNATTCASRIISKITNRNTAANISQIRILIFLKEYSPEAVSCPSIPFCGSAVVFSAVAFSASIMLFARSLGFPNSAITSASVFPL